MKGTIINSKLCQNKRKDNMAHRRQALTVPMAADGHQWKKFWPLVGYRQWLPVKKKIPWPLKIGFINPPICFMKKPPTNGCHMPPMAANGTQRAPDHWASGPFLEWFNPPLADIHISMQPRYVFFFFTQGPPISDSALEAALVQLDQKFITSKRLPSS